MNKFKKMELEKLRKEREGLSESEIKKLEERRALAQEILIEVRGKHSEDFPEESDFMLDDHVDSKLRREGKNPMSQEYIDRVKSKRDVLAMPQLTGNGMPDGSKDSFIFSAQNVLLKRLKAGKPVVSIKELLKAL